MVSTPTSDNAEACPNMTLAVKLDVKLAPLTTNNNGRVFRH